jgi:glycosyltransferase involved in cell wall biosynthesis
VIVHHLYYRLRPQRWQRWLDRWLEFLALAAAHRVIVNSRATAEEVAELGIPRSRMVVLPPGVDVVPPPVLREPGELISLLAVGNVVPRKGLDVLLEALRDAPFDFRLDLVGDPDYDPDYRARLEALADDPRLRGRVAFLGRLTADELEQAYRSADVFVVPSRWEGFGMALLDALLYGLPVVASRVGAIPELVDDGDNGLLVPAGDPQALATALARLAGDPELRRRMGIRGRVHGLRLARPWDQVAAAAAEVVAGAGLPGG